MIPTLEHSWLNILGLQVGTHFFFIFQYKRDSLSTFKKTDFTFLFFLLFEFALQFFFPKKPENSIYDNNSRNLLSRVMEFYTWWCCNLFSLSKTVHRPVYLSIWCKNHSTACLPCTGMPSVPSSQSHLYSWCTVGKNCNFQICETDINTNPLPVTIKLQGPSWQTVFFYLALTDRSTQVRFWLWNFEIWEICY